MLWTAGNTAHTHLVHFFIFNIFSLTLEQTAAQLLQGAGKGLTLSRSSSIMINTAVCTKYGSKDSVYPQEEESRTDTQSHHSIYHQKNWLQGIEQDYNHNIYHVYSKYCWARKKMVCFSKFLFPHFISSAIPLTHVHAHVPAHMQLSSWSLPIATDSSF